MQQEQWLTNTAPSSPPFNMSDPCTASEALIACSAYSLDSYTRGDLKEIYFDFDEDDSGVEDHTVYRCYRNLTLGSDPPIVINGAEYQAVALQLSVIGRIATDGRKLYSKTYTEEQDVPSELRSKNICCVKFWLEDLGDPFAAAEWKRAIKTLREIAAQAERPVSMSRLLRSKLDAESEPPRIRLRGFRHHSSEAVRNIEYSITMCCTEL